MSTFRSIIIFLTTVLIGSLFPTEATGQSWTMVPNDTIFIDACSANGGVIYDNGGPDGNYSNSFNGWVVISATPGVAITLNGDYGLEGCCDYITVWDGPINGGTQLFYDCTSGTISLTSTSGRMTIQFHSDYSVTNWGYALTWGIDGTTTQCTSNISNLTVSAVTTTSATLTWTSDVNSLKLDYGQGEQTVSGGSTTITGLTPNTFYNINLYAEGEGSSPCCVARSSFRTLCGQMTAPVVERFDDYGYGDDVFPTCWSLVSNIDGAHSSNVTNATFASSGASLRMSATQSGYYSIAIMPEITVPDINQLTMRLKLRAPYANSKIEIGVCSGTEQFNHNFTPLDTLVVSSANQWMEFTVGLDNYSGSGRRIALRMAGALQPGSNYTVYVDDIYVESCGVWHIGLSRRNANSLWLQWDEYNDPTVTVEYGPEGFPSGSGTTLSNVISPLEISNLNPSTRYEFRFMPTCASTSQSATVQRFTASTLEGPENRLTLCYDFEGGGTLPQGWRRCNEYSGTPQTSTSYRYEGSRSLQMRPYYESTKPIAVLPMVDTVEMDQLTVSFRVYSDGYTTGRIVVGVMEWPEDPTSFEAVDTLFVDQSNRWQAKQVSLSGYTGSGKYIALMAFDPNTSYNYMYIDNVQVGTCGLSNVSVTNIGSRRLELRWDEVDGNYHGDSVEVEYGGVGFAEGEGVRLSVAVRGNSVVSVGGRQRVVVTGLQPDSTYEFRIYGQCNISTQQCAKTTLTVHMLEQDLMLPYCVDFEGMADGSYPGGWSRPTMYDNYPRVRDDGYPKHSGNRALYLRSYRTLEYHSTVVLPLFDIDSVGGVVVSFWAWGESSDGHTVQIGVMEDPNDESTFVEVANTTVPYNTWSKHDVLITNYTGEGRYLALRQYNNYYWSSSGLWIDDLIVGEAAAAGGRVGSVTSHSATFMWNPLGRAHDGTQLEWGAAGFTHGTGHSVTLPSGVTTFHIDTLTPGTDYDVYITGLSSENTVSCDFSPIPFSTFAHPTASSYCYGFEDQPDNGWPEGWTRPEVYNSSPRVRTWTAHTGSKSLYFYSYNCSTPYHASAVMPYLEESSLDGLTLRFWAYGNGSNTHLAVGFTSDPNNTASFDTLDIFPIDHWGSWIQYAVDLSQYSGAGRHIVFRWATPSSCNSGELFIDDISITRCSLSRIRVYNETTTSATIDWVPSGPVDSVTIEYGLQGFAPGSGSFLTTTDTVVTLTALPEAGVRYDFYLRPHCTGSSQVCSELLHSFSTTPWNVADGWCCDFEQHDGNNSMPWWWRKVIGQDDWPKIWTHSDPLYFTSSNSAFEFRASSGGSNLAVMPASTVPLGSLVVSFNLRCPESLHPERATLIVGVMPNPYDADAFVAIDTIHPSYLYRRVDISLASYTGSYRYVAFMYLDNDYRITYIDDLSLSLCAPANIHTTAVADSSVSLSWQKLGYSGKTFVHYGLDGTPIAEGRIDSTANNSITISGLYPDSSYWFYLFGPCADTLQECHGTRIHQRTLAEPMRAPVCIDFETASTSNGLPSGWFRPYGNDEAAITSDRNHTYSGSHSIRLYSYSCNDNNNDRTNLLVMPPLSPDENLGSLFLEFYTWFDNISLRLDIGIMTDPYDTSTFTTLTTLSSNNYWRRVLLNLSSYTGSGRHIAFRSHTQYCNSGWVYIDDINLRHCAVRSANASLPTLSSLTLNYNASSGTSGVWVEYKAVGGPGSEFAPGTGDTVFVSSSPFTFTSLESATWYVFHLYPDCGSNCNYLSVRAQTLHPGVNIPYCESFDLFPSGDFPNNWRRHSTYSSDLPRITDHYYARSSGNVMLFEANDTLYSMAIMPQTLVGQTCPLVDSLYANFWTYSDYNWNIASLVVGYVTDANDSNTFVTVDTVRPTYHAVWEHHTVPIHNFSSSDTYLAFKLVSSNGYYCNLRIDDLCIEKCVASDVSVSSITQNSVTITWNSFGVDSLVCEYGPEGFEAGSGTLVTLRSSPAVITDLMDGTEYQFTFASVCGCNSYGATYFPGGGSGGGNGGAGGCHYCGWCWGWVWDNDEHRWWWCWGPWNGHPWSYYPGSGSGGGYTFLPPVIDSVRTQSAFLHIPYCEGFEEYDTIGWPRSWRRIGGQTPGYPSLTTTNSHSGTHSIDFYAPVGSSNYAALAPLEPGTTSSMVLSFYAYSTNSWATGNSARFIVGIMTDPDDPATFSPLDTIRLNNTARWEQQHVDLAPYAGTGQYVAFRFAPINASYHYFIDDLYLGTCAIANPQVTTTQSAVILSWESIHSPDRILVEYGPQGFLPGSEASLGTLTFYSSPADLTAAAAILPDNNHDLYLTALCSDTATYSCFNAPITLNPHFFTPWCEDFEGVPSGVMPQGWKVVRSHDTYPLTETQHGEQTLTFYPCTGTSDNVILLPPLPDSDSLQSKWVYASFSTSSSNSIFLEFGTLTDTNNASSFVQMGYMTNSTFGQLCEKNLQMVSNTINTQGARFAIRTRSISGCRWIYLAKVMLANYPYPTSISSTPLGVAQQRIQWENLYDNAYYGLQYGYGDQWQTLALSDSCSALLTNLEPGKNYEVYFISPQGESLCLPYRFSTPPYLELPFCDDFEGHSRYSIPSGWAKASSYNDNGDFPRVEHNVWYTSPLNSIQFYNNYSSNRWDQFSLPDFDIDSIKNLTLRFKYLADYVDNNMMIVGVQTEQHNPSTFVPVDTVYALRSQTWRDVVVSMSRYSGSGRYITFRYYQSNSGYHYSYIDDLLVSPCPQPLLSVAGARQVKATLPHDGQADYWIEYGTGVFDQGLGDTLVHVTTNPFFITGLQPSTQYSFYFRCHEDQLACGDPLSITTADEKALPFCESFDSYNNAIVPPGWFSYSSYGDNYPRTYYSNYNSCCMSLDFYCNNTNLQYTTLPDFFIDSIRHLELYFSLRIENITHTRLVIGVMDNRNDFSTFTPIDSLSCPQNYNHYPQHVSLANYTGSGRFVTFLILNDDGSRRALYVDDLRVNSYPTPQITLATANTIRIIRESQRDFWIELASPDASQGGDSNQWFHITHDTFDIPNLQYLTTYHLYHHTDSGSISCFPLTSITTSTILPMPYCDNFDSYPNWEMPTGWTMNNPYRSDYPCKNSNGHIQFYNNCNSNSRSYAIMPDLDVETLHETSLHLNVWSENNNLFLLVGVMTDKNDVATFTIVDTLRPSGTGFWQPMQVSFSSYQGNGRFIAFCFVNPNGNCSSMYIDDLYIQACPRPSVQLTGGTSVALYNSTTLQPYWLEYGLQGTTPGDSLNTFLHVTEDTLLITELQPNTTYDFYTRCDSTPSSCYPLTARITTSRIQSLPYCEEFINYGTGSSAFPTGWRRLTYNGSNDRVYVNSDGDANDGRSLRFYTYRDYYALAVLPEIDIADIRDLSLRVRMWSQCSTNPSSYSLEVGVMDNPDDYITFHPVDTLQNLNACQWEELTASLADYDGQGRFVALRMCINTSDWRSIYIDRLEVLSCHLPASLQATLHSHNTVRISANEQSSTGFWVEYDTTGFTQSTGTKLFITQLPADIVLENLATYDFYFLCDTLVASCAPAQTVTTMDAPLTIPYCENFDAVTINQMPEGWTKLRVGGDYGNDCYVSQSVSHSTSHSLQMCTYYPDRHPYAVLPDLEVENLRDLSISFWMRNNNHSTFIVELGVMSDPRDAATFWPIKQFTNSSDNTWQRMQATLADIPGDARFIALRLTKTNYSWDWVYIDDLYISPCGADDFRVTAIESNYVTFDWKQTSTPIVTIEYGPVGFTRGSGTVVTINQEPPYTLEGLDNLTNYQFYFTAQCEEDEVWCTTNYEDSATVFTPAGGTGCIDPTNLEAEYTTCFTGTYSNPYANQEVVDYGYGSILSRHTVHMDPNETDPRTGGQLHTVPEGSEASVRLGNWGSGGQAEAVSYSLVVDTSQFDLLLLKYAAVLQDNDHPSVAQPRFKLELLDENGVLIDSCSAADFIANQSLGWNLVPETYVLWKDWTAVGVDVGAYHGQTVTIRLTVFDCSDGDHFGYAYFTVSCMTKRLVTSHCGAVAQNSFSAPEGFAYRWYSNLDTSTFSTEGTIVVPSNNAITYYCNLSFVDNPGCSFTMSAFAGTRYPLSLFDTSVVIRDCHFEVTFTNQSTISMDGTTPIGTGEGTESAQWDFGNGTSSTQYHPTAIYTEPGTYTVQLISSLASGACSDTLTQDITLAFPSTNPHIVGPSDRCINAAPDTLVVQEARSWSPWPSDTIVVAPTADSTYLLTVTDSNGCTYNLSHTIAVHPIHQLDHTVAICEGDNYTFAGEPLTTEGLYHDTLYTNVYGCDSIVTLTLTVNANTSSDTSADECDRFTWYGTEYTTSTDTPTHHTLNAVGCDSTVTLHLTIRNSSAESIHEEVFENDLPFLFNGQSFANDTANAIIYLTNAVGCDSTINFSLTVHWNERTNIDSTLCADQLPLVWNGVTFTAAGTKPATLTNAIGADSVVSMTLHVNPVYNDTIPQSICADESLTFEGTDYYGTDAGLHPHLLQTTAGCDSLRVLNLEVRALTIGDTAADECDRFTWYSTEYISSIDTSTHHTLNVAGCDSTVTLHLTIRNSTSSTIHEEVLENDLPHIFNGVSFENDTLSAAVIIPNSVGCDSVITYSLTVHWNERTYVDSTVCDDVLPLEWNGVTFTAAGTRTATLHNSMGADSIVAMTLHVNPTYNDTLSHSICADGSLTFEGTDYYGTDAGFHPHLLQTTAGCDSLRVLDLEVRALTTGDTAADECDRFSWYGTEYTISTDTPTHHTLNTAGCDSTVTLHLTIRNSTTSTVHEEAFENDLPHVFNGVPFSNDTLGAILHLTNAAGCDSTINFSLTVHWNDRTNVDSTLCADRLPLVWNGVTFTAAGTRPATLTNAIGADSVVSMTLHVNPVYNDTIPYSICADETLTFEGTDYSGTDAGLHPHLLQTASGCDSLRVLNLEVRALTTGDTAADECDRFSWYGTEYTASTHHSSLITHHFTNAALCDSTVTLHLTVRHSSDTAITETIVENQLPYTFNGTTFTENSDLSVITIPNAVGCDSTIGYTLNVHWNTGSTLDSNLCFNHLPVTWNGAVFDTTVANTTLLRTVVIPSSSGSDSTVTMRLHVRPVYNDTIPHSICDNEQYGFEGDTYYGNDAGLHAYSLHTATYGCDSLRVLDLEVRATTTGDTVADECDQFTWYGTEYTASTETPTRHTLNAANCDSTVTLHLTIRHSTAGIFRDTIVENLLPHTYHDSTFADSISHTTVVFPNAAQCDSVVDYSLFVHWNVDTTLYDTICHDALPLSWNGVSFDTAAVSQSSVLTRTAVIAAHTGADSTVTMHLTVHPNYDHHTQAVICDNQSYVFGNNTFKGSDGSTEHLDSLLSVHGCDSLSTLHLTVNPTYDHHFFDTVCSNQTVTFSGETCDTTGVYLHSLLSVHGCDSLSTLHLQVWPAYDNHTYDTVCDDSSRFFIDSAYRQTGVFPYQFASAHACDSLETLHLKVYPTYDIHLHDTIYDGDRYSFEGTVYDTTGVYPTLLQAVFGCDSLRTLHLQRNRRTYHDSTLCQNALPLVWNGVTFSEGQGSRTGHLQSFADSVHLNGLNGIDSLVVMRVTAVDTTSSIEQLHACDSVTWRDGITYASTTSAPFLRLVGQWGCDSIRHLDLTVDYTRRAVDRHQACDSMQWIDSRWYYRDTVGPLDTLVTTRGCDSIVTLDLAVHHATYEETLDTFCFGTVYNWRHFSVGEAEPAATVDTYLTDTLLTLHHCDSVLAIRLTQMAKPVLVLDTAINCGLGQYRLSLTTDMPWWRWWADPEDPAIDGIENVAQLLVAPETTTDYHVTVDYRRNAFCPLSGHVSLRPIVVPEAELKVNPEALTLSNMELDAYDISREFESRSWYINRQLQAEQGRHLHHYADSDLDSVVVALSVYNGMCHDTALRVVPVLKVSLFAPNAFTPTQEDNSRFVIVARGLLEADLYIYNREGLLVYHTRDLEQGWDGRSENGTPCKQGNYVWKLVYRALDRPNAERTEVGSVLLIR